MNILRQCCMRNPPALRLNKSTWIREYFKKQSLDTYIQNCIVEIGFVHFVHLSWSYHFIG